MHHRIDYAIIVIGTAIASTTFTIHHRIDYIIIVIAAYLYNHSADNRLHAN